jgi:osmotically inducible lipoprotein OsmB
MTYNKFWRSIMATTKTIAKTTMACLLAASTLTSCGETKGERALSGGAIGAGVGAAGAAVLSADPVTGALVGGAVGAATGALTDKKQINLDKK